MSDVRPNIILVVADDLAFGDLGAYDSPLIRTPNLDALAATGLVCEEMYAASTGDSPSRCEILTGRFGARYLLSDSVTTGLPGLPGRATTIASLLNDAGYATGLFGQWRLGSAPGETPADHGFDRFRGSLYGVDVAPVAWQDDGAVVDEDFDAALAARDMTEHALEFVGAHPDTPVLAVLAHLGPQIPYSAEPAFFGQSAAGEYGDVVEQMDHFVGALVEGLREQEQQGGRRTLVVFTSDNGPRYEGFTHERRGKKPEVFDGGVRVPLIASWLGSGIPVRDTMPRSLVDVAPSLCALAGVEAPDDLDGVDFSPLLNGDATVDRGPVYMWSGASLNASREGSWKLHAWQGIPVSADNAQYWPMLFNFDDDVHEGYSVAKYHPDVVERMRADLDRTQLDVTTEAATNGAIQP